MLDVRSERHARDRAAARETVVTGVVGTSVDACEHLREAPHERRPEPATECEDCVAEGLTVWVHLRACLECGHVACCDSSPRRHASAHFAATGHPVVRSAEPGEHWRWCYVDQRLG